ncbi:MAG: hypothetical protein QM628_02515 [Propionicimonas sp.]
MVIVEGQPVDALRVTVDGEGAFMEFSVVERAKTDQVGWLGDSAIPPVLKVVVLEEAGGGAAGVAATFVAIFDQDTDTLRNDAVLSSDRDGFTVGLPHRDNACVAGVPISEVPG